jgi:hypothetical protein
MPSFTCVSSLHLPLLATPQLATLKRAAAGDEALDLLSQFKLTELIRYMRQWNGKPSKSRERCARTPEFVAGAQFGSHTELVPHRYRLLNPKSSVTLPP